MYVALDKNADRFSYNPAVDNPPEQMPADHQLDIGFIHETIKRNLQNGKESEAYLCGPPPMIDAVTKVLVEKGVPEIRILYDKF